MSGVQVHSPATEEEYENMPRHTDAELVGAVSTWREHAGWCSACRAKNVTVAHMGTAERNFGMCADCLTRLWTCIGGAS